MHRIMLWFVLLGLVGGTVRILQAQGGEMSVKDLVMQSEINIHNNPTDGQRYCRDALHQIARDPYGQYLKEKIKCYSLLGESYFHLGRIGDAAVRFDSVVTLADTESPEYRKALQFQGQIGNLFAPLRIKIRNKIIPLLSFIEGIDVEFRYPHQLTDVQVRRLAVLQSIQGRNIDEFQFVGIDPSDENAYLEIAYFPLLRSNHGAYSLIVDGMRRYRFNFSLENKEDPLEIIWEDGAQWQLVERVPKSMLKVETPSKYYFTPSGSEDETFAVNWSGNQHVYMPANSTIELTLEESDERGWERSYHIALYAITVSLALMGLFGAR